MHWDIYLPIAGHTASIFLLLGLGGAVGFLSGFFGVGGGFLMTPVLIMWGVPPVVAAASDSSQIVAATTSGTYAHHRMGNVDVKLGLLLLGGGFIGGTIGVEVIKVLRQLGDANFIIRVTYVLMLSIVGVYMLRDGIRNLRRGSSELPTLKEAPAPSRFGRLARSLPFQVYFEKSGVTHSPILPLVLGCFVGLLAAVMGVGGGFIMVPMMVFVLGIPMRVAVGTNLFQEVFMCANVTFMQSVTNHSVDLVLAVFLLVGSSIGAQFGARSNRRFKPDELKVLLASIILLVMAKMLLALVLPPGILLDVKGVG